MLVVTWAEAKNRLLCGIWDIVYEKGDVICHWALIEGVVWFFSRGNPKFISGNDRRIQGLKFSNDSRIREVRRG